MVKRFEETVSIQPQNLSTGFVQGQNTLLNRLQQFKQSTEQLVGAVETRRGAEEAQQVQLEKEGGITKAPKKREAGIAETILTGGISTRQYNKSIQTAYLASLANDAKQGINAIEIENADNIAQFNDKVAGFASGVLKGVDPAARQETEIFLNNQISNARNRVHRNTIKKNKLIAKSESLEAVNSFGNDAALLAREGNQIGSAEAINQSFVIIDGMVEAGDLLPDVAAKKKREIEREASEQGLRLRFDGVAESEGLDKAFEELEAISNKPAKGWTPDEWDSFITSEQADLRQKAVRNQQLNVKKDLDTARQVSNLKIKAKTGVNLKGEPVDPSEIIGETNKLFDAGIITGNERSSIITSQIQKMQDESKNAASKQKVASRINGANEIALTQSDVDLTWDEDIAPAINELPSDLQNSAIAQFVDSTKIVPSQIIEQVNNNLNSDDAELVSQSADLMDRLDSVRGIPDTNFSPTDRAYAETVVALQKNLDPQEAVKLARQNTNPNDKGRIETRKGIIKAEKLELKYPDIINSAFDPFFGADVVDDISRGQLTQEYKVLFEQHFIAGMSQNSAQKKSLQIIERNWSVDQATNKMLKYPTQDFYAVNGSVDYIKRDLFTSVRDATVGLPEFTTEDILLISDGTTARQASQGRPSYLVAINASDQGIIPLMGFRYIPDMQAQVIKEQKANEKMVKEGRKINTSRERKILKSFDKLRGF